MKKCHKDKNMIHPTEQEYKKILKETLGKMTCMGRCLGIYVSGKHKDERCFLDLDIHCKIHSISHDSNLL